MSDRQLSTTIHSHPWSMTSPSTPHVILHIYCRLRQYIGHIQQCQSNTLPNTWALPLTNFYPPGSPFAHFLFQPNTKNAKIRFVLQACIHPMLLTRKNSAQYLASLFPTSLLNLPHTSTLLHTTWTNKWSKWALNTWSPGYWRLRKSLN